MRANIQNLISEVKKVVKGKDDVIEKVISAMIAGGHILLEDIPGVGKTTMAVALSKSFSMDYRRVQFTPDVLPSDLVGFNMYNSKTGAFEYKEGCVYCNFLLADEINRTSPKTQSALLEVMEEGKATVDGVTRMLPVPFTVLATQNPFGSAGTQKLPESQLDRFMICLSIGYPNHNSAIDVLKYNTNVKPEINPVLSIDDYLAIKEQVENIHVDDSIYDFIVSFTENTRKSDLISLGLSPRGSIALLKMAKATAYINERDYVIPDDVVECINSACGHRIVLSPKARATKMNNISVLETILKETELPKM